MDVTRLSVNMIRNMGKLCLDDDVLMLDKIHTLFNRGITYRLDHVCVALVVRGSADFQIDNVRYHVKINDMLVIIHQQEVSYYAERLHLTPRYVSACIKAETGHSAIDVIAEKLMQQARKSLLNEEKTISQVSYDLGFSDQSAFGKVFRMHEGDLGHIGNQNKQ